MPEASGKIQPLPGGDRNAKCKPAAALLRHLPWPHGANGRDRGPLLRSVVLKQLQSKATSAVRTAVTGRSRKAPESVFAKPVCVRSPGRPLR
jgi:hypothetical protein